MKMISKIDEVFDIEPDDGTEVIQYDELENLPSVNIIHEDYDDKDSEIENQFQDIYDKALDAFDTQMEATEDIEGKFLARNSEVANQLLNTALSAAKEKSNLKKHADHRKLKDPNASPGNTTNIQNNIMMDRNELLKMLKGGE